MRSTTSAGVSPAHGPGDPSVPRQSATEPATCGAAMLVPDRTAVPPPGASNVMHVPGAAIVCALPAAVAAKFEYRAARSSSSLKRHGSAAPAAPSRPSLSLIAVTVRTSGYAAGTVTRRPSKARPELPADATTVTPAEVARQIAWYSGSSVMAHEVGLGPALPTLMFATLMPCACALAATQSMPQMRPDSVPVPAAPRTFTDTIFGPGATPTTPPPPLPAAIVPATCVPWPLSSVVLPPGVTQFVPETTLRSGFARST